MLNFRSILECVQQGSFSIDEGIDALKRLHTEDLGFAQIDHHRALRKGFPEVVYCEGKTPEQAAQILIRLSQSSEGPVLGTRADPQVYELVKQVVPEMVYHPLSRMLVFQGESLPATGNVLVLCAGTSDIPVAEEAVLTGRAMGAKVTSVYDVGVAGIHRLFAHMEEIQQARVLVVVAGMEGALASVVGGLVDKPVIAVPTSVGYGANFAGLAPLLAMLNSCASGVGVVNIDNGFGAGFLAAQINGLGG